MKQRKRSKYVHEGQYVAEIDVELLEDDTGWSPYRSVEDAHKLNDVRDALRQGELEAAAQYGRIYELLSVAQRRLKEIRSGAVETVPGEDVFAKIWNDRAQ